MGLSLKACSSFGSVSLCSSCDGTGYISNYHGSDDACQMCGEEGIVFRGAPIPPTKAPDGKCRRLLEVNPAHRATILRAVRSAISRRDKLLKKYDKHRLKAEILERRIRAMVLGDR